MWAFDLRVTYLAGGKRVTALPGKIVWKVLQEARARHQQAQHLVGFAVQLDKEQRVIQWRNFEPPMRGMLAAQVRIRQPLC